jgi:hypothetical protein
MNFDWQTIAVALIILAALFYVVRRGLARLRSFRLSAKTGGACATGCGKCGEEEAPARPANVLVQIGSSKTARRR